MKKLKVLIIEDDNLISFHISQVLNRLDCKVLETVTNFDDAISVASQNHIDLIISDIKILGILDGVDASKKIQEIYNCEVLFLTAHVDDETINKASAVNSIGYLVKPFRENELVLIIKMAIQRKKEKEKNVVLENGYFYDIQNSKLYQNENLIKLTKNESKLFNLLIHNLNQVITYDYLDEIVWYDKIVSESNRRQLIFRFKNKLKDLNVEVIQGIGLCLKAK